MELVFLADIGLNDGAVALVEVGQYFKQLLVGLVDPPDEIGEFVLLEILAEGPHAVLHKLVDLDGVVVLVGPVDGEAVGADEPPVLAVGVDTDEGGVLPVGVAVVGFDEVPEALRELLHISLHRHTTIKNQYSYVNKICHLITFN